jgi:hypothetical protein
MAARQSSIEDLLKAIQSEPTITANLKAKAADVSNELAARPVFQTDIWIYRVVVIVLGVTVLSTIFGGLALAFRGDLANYKLPSEIVAIGSAAVGALAGLLAPSPKDNS